MSPESTAERVIEELDKVVLLSAAWDCISERGKEKFKHSLIKLFSKPCGEIGEGADG